MTSPSSTVIQIAKRAERFAIDNSPLLLTVVGVTGAVTTALLTGKATFKAAEIIADAQYMRNVSTTHVSGQTEKLSKKEKVNLVWKQYIPPVGVGLVTVAAIVGANQIGTRRAAALAAAYSVSEKAFNEYKEKVVEKLGDHKEQAVRDDVAQDRVNRNPVGDREVIIAGGGKVLCYDHYTDRYFKSSVEEIKKAMNDLNYRINNDGYASLSDFYDLIGLPHTSFSDEVGWNSEKLLDINFSTVMSSEGEPCISIDFRIEPVRKYFRLY